MQFLLVIIVIVGVLFFGIQSGKIDAGESTKETIDTIASETNRASEEILGKESSDSIKIITSDITQKAGIFFDRMTSHTSKKSHAEYMLKETTCNTLKELLIHLGGVANASGNKLGIVTEKINNACLKELTYEIMSTSNLSSSILVKGLLTRGKTIDENIFHLEKEELIFRAKIKKVFDDTIIETICVDQFRLYPFVYSDYFKIEEKEIPESFRCTIK